MRFPPPDVDTPVQRGSLPANRTPWRCTVGVSWASCAAPGKRIPAAVQIVGQACNNHAAGTVPVALRRLLHLALLVIGRSARLLARLSLASAGVSVRRTVTCPMSTGTVKRRCSRSRPSPRHTDTRFATTTRQTIWIARRLFGGGGKRTFLVCSDRCRRWAGHSPRSALVWLL